MDREGPFPMPCMIKCFIGLQVNDGIASSIGTLDTINSPLNWRFKKKWICLAPMGIFPSSKFLFGYATRRPLCIGACYQYFMIRYWNIWKSWEITFQGDSFREWWNFFEMVFKYVWILTWYLIRRNAIS